MCRWLKYCLKLLLQYTKKQIWFLQNIFFFPTSSLLLTYALFRHLHVRSYHFTFLWSRRNARGTQWSKFSVEFIHCILCFESYLLCLVSVNFFRVLYCFRKRNAFNEKLAFLLNLNSLWRFWKINWTNSLVYARHKLLSYRQAALEKYEKIMKT